LSEWSRDAIALLDLHGGDIGEIQASYIVFQKTGDTAEDRRGELLARCFDTPFVVGLNPKCTEASGRSCTALAKSGRFGLVTESGDHGVLEEKAILMHQRGILNVARVLGVLCDRAPDESSAAVCVDEYVFLTAPAAGLFYPRVEPGDMVSKGEILAEIRDAFGRCRAKIEAPTDGVVLWRWCLQFIKQDAWVGAIGHVSC
jgi:predicted deacylase